MLKKLALSSAALGLAASATVALSSPASAAPAPYDPNVARTANPANVCKSIPGTILADAALLGMPAPDLSGFDYVACVTTLARGRAVVEPVELFGNPYENCAAMGLPYPMTLHSGEVDAEEDALLPDLTVRNDKECGNALYAYHAIMTAVFGEEPPAP